MKVFGFDVRSPSTMKKQEKTFNEFLVDTKYKNIRSAMDVVETLGDSDVRIPRYPLDESTLYEIADLSDTLRTVHHQLKKAIFRKGAIVKEKFASKCTECKKEFENPVDECDDCKSAKRTFTNIREPKPSQRIILENILKNCNDNNQGLLDVSKQVEDDLNIIDDGYILCAKDYFFDDNNCLVGVAPIEFLRIYPKHIRIVSDKTGRLGRNSSGELLKTCVVHRNEIFIGDEIICSRCGRELLTAHYRAKGPDGEFIYYVENEIFHKSKYKPSLTYGFSPIFSLWMKCITLLNQDKYVKDYYVKQRPPRGLLFVKTPNMNSLKKAWNWMLEMFAQNPHMIPPIAIEGEKQGNQFVQFVDFMRGLDEMQFTQTRDEYRRTIGAVYGVQPIFQNDVSTSGGLNNEGMQITVTNQAIEDGQMIYNDGFYQWVAKQLEVTDYVIELNPSEEQDEMATLERQSIKIQNARMMQAIGFDVLYNQDGDFEYEPTDVVVEPPKDISVDGLPQIGASNSTQTNFTTPSTTKNNIQKKNDLTYEQESKIINENKKTSEAQKQHKFKRAKFTYPNAHPRCLLCGSEESHNGLCEGSSISNKLNNLSDNHDGETRIKEDAPVTTETTGVHQPSFRDRKRRNETYLAIGKVLSDVKKETNSSYDITKAKDETDDLINFIEGNIFLNDFKHLSHKKSEIVKEYIVKAIHKGYSMPRIMKYIERVGGKNMTPFNAETIARTETQALKNTMREWSFKKVDPKEEMKYKWINPMDHRTTDICSNIVAKTRGGVTLKKLRQLIKTEAQSHGFKSREWTPHINCRSTFVRVVKPKPNV